MFDFLSGPLDITELVSTNEDDKSSDTDDNVSKENEDDDDDDDDDDDNDEGGSYDALDITDLEPALTCNKDTLSRIENRLGSSINGNILADENQFISPTFTRITGDNLTTTPLKGILKHREVTPKRVDLDLKGDCEENTRYNTVRNSGKQVYVPQQKTADTISRKLASQLPRPVLEERSMDNPDIVVDDVSPELDVELKWRKATAVINDTITSEDAVSIRANSAFYRKWKHLMMLTSKFRYVCT